MTQPAIISAAKKSVITPRAALVSTIRVWFLYRDEALWAFVGGTEADNPLEEIEVDENTRVRIAEANEASKRAWAIANKIAMENEQKASTVMREAINELLAGERPGFLLSLEHIPGSF
ncbi:MAG TPA: hypothetical protein VGG62_17785 [Terracidiphilus sp.]|jgi:hypothetical protein